MNIDKILKLIDCKSLEGGYQSKINEWQQLYQGHLKGFHDYMEYNGVKQTKRTRSTLGMAKAVCELWADTMINPETSIIVDDGYQARLDDILGDNKFFSQANYLVDHAFGVGTGAIIVSKINGEVKTSSVDANMMYPIIKDSQFGWATVSEYAPNTVYVSVHYDRQRNNVGEYVYRVDNYIVNIEKDKYILLSDAELKENYKLKPIELYKDPMFHLIKPANANNTGIQTPYGMSIYANAISEFKGVDLAYSGLNYELEANKARVFYKASAVDVEDGKVKFTDNEAYVILNQGEGSLEEFDNEGTVKVVAENMRIDSYIDALKTNLNLAGRKCGLGDNVFSFNEGNVYTTATQVVSQNSAFYKTRAKHLVIAEEMLIGIVKAIYLLDKDTQYTGEVTIDFDDSIIVDTEARKKEAMALYNMGLISEVGFWMMTDDLDEENAKQFVKQQLEFKGLVEVPDEETPID